MPMQPRRHEEREDYMAFPLMNFVVFVSFVVAFYCLVAVGFGGAGFGNFPSRIDA